MDPHDRDELRESDLGHFLFHLNEWWDKHGTQMLVVVLVVLAVVVGWRLWQQHKQSAHESAWRDLATTTSPDAFRRVAQQYEDPTVQAIAYLRGGDLVVHQIAAPEDKPMTAKERGDALTEAASMYRSVLGIPAVHPIYALNAQLGLAAVAEEQSEWKQADELYSQVERAAAQYPAIAGQAKERRALLDRLAKPVTFAPELPTTQAAESQPATLPAHGRAGAATLPGAATQPLP